jgi:hypothetical protein
MPAAECTGQLADTRPQPARTIPNNRFHDSAVPLIRAGSGYGFLLRFDLERNPDAHLAAQFTDDAGLHCQIDHDLNN